MDKRQRLIRFLFVILGFIILVGALMIGYILTRKNNTNDVRDKANSNTPGGIENVTASLTAKPQNVGLNSKIEVNVILSSVTDVSGVDLIVKYPEGVTLDETVSTTAATQANAECQAQNFKLDTVVRVTPNNDTHIIAMTKVGINGESKGTFCIGTLTFNSGISTQLANFELLDVSKWQITGTNSNGYNPVLDTNAYQAKVNIRGMVSDPPPTTVTSSPTTITPTQTPTITSTPVGTSPTTTSTPLTTSPTSTSTPLTTSPTSTGTNTSTQTPTPISMQTTKTSTPTPIQQVVITLNPTVSVGQVVLVIPNNTVFSTPKPQLKGKTTPNTKVKVSITGNSQSGIVTSGSDGFFTFTPSTNLLIGQYSYTASLVNANGVVTGSPSAPVSFSIAAAGTTATPYPKTNNLPNTSNPTNVVGISLVSILFITISYLIIRRKSVSIR